MQQLTSNLFVETGIRGCNHGMSNTARTVAEKIIAAIEEPAEIVRILTHLGVPARAPPRAPARPLGLFRAA